MSRYFKKKYENGITLVYRQIDNPHFFYLTHYYSLGSKDFPVGLLHFFEHCAFASPRDFDVPNYTKFLQQNTISKDASTSRENLEFHYSGLQEDWRKIVDSFLSCFENKEISHEVFENEKKRIFHEIEEENSNVTAVTKELFSLFYRDPRIASPALGDRKNLKSHRYDDLTKVMRQLSDESFVVYIQSSLPFDAVTEYLDPTLSLLPHSKRTSATPPSYATGGNSNLLVSRLEDNAIVEFGFLYSQRYRLNDLLCLNIIEDFLSFEGSSTFSQTMRFELGLYDYRISKLLYQNDMMAIFSFFVQTAHLDALKLKLKKYLTASLSLSPEEFSAIKKKLKFVYLRYFSDPAERFEIERELYQVLGEEVFDIDIIDALEKLSLVELENFHQKFLEESIQALVVGEKNNP